MPIEIRELVIKATVVQDAGTTAESNASGNNNTSSTEEMVNTCVEKVLEIIRDKNGR
jgi:hypothetical protein